MCIDEALLRDLASLAGLTLDASRLDELRDEMQRLVRWMDQMPAHPAQPSGEPRDPVSPPAGLDASATGLEGSGAMQLRDDVPRPCLDLDEVRRLAPRFADGYVIVPCVMPASPDEPGGDP